jgi:gamma-glutamylcyclotransferase (GGCT)/AIG2-like uncharacterized protein YtfP
MREVPHYIVDVGDMGEHGVVLIELSPFLRCTGTALFNWKVNKHLLMHGPFEFRLRTTEYPGIDDLFEAGWGSRWNDVVPDYWDFFPSEAPNWFARLAGRFGAFKKLPVTRVFVYGLLKSGGFYHRKFLQNAKFVGSAVTIDRMRLFLDANGAPQLVEGAEMGNQVRGEVFEITTEAMVFFERNKYVRKGMYRFEEIEVRMDGRQNVERVKCLVRNLESVAEDADAVECITEYQAGTPYNSVMDTLAKAQFYLGYTIANMAE